MLNQVAAFVLVSLARFSAVQMVSAALSSVGAEYVRREGLLRPEPNPLSWRRQQERPSWERVPTSQRASSGQPQEQPQAREQRAWQQPSGQPWAREQRA